MSVRALVPTVRSSKYKGSWRGSFTTGQKWPPYARVNIILTVKQVVLVSFWVVGARAAIGGITIGKCLIVAQVPRAYAGWVRLIQALGCLLYW